MDGTNTTTNWIIAGLVALVVIIGGGWLIARDRAGIATDVATSTGTTSGVVSGKSDDSKSTAGGTTPPSSRPTPSPTPSSAGKNLTASATGETITVEDQPSGSSVVIDTIKLSKPSFVAIRDTRGWYPGWQYVQGSQSNVTVPLKRNTTAGQTYEAVIFVDDGDGVFEIHGGDMLVTGTAGAPVSSTFTAK